MDSYNIAEAKTHLSKLVGRAEAGESVAIMRRGRPVVKLVRLDQERSVDDLSWLSELRSELSKEDDGFTDTIRALRDDARY